MFFEFTVQNWLLLSWKAKLLLLLETNIQTNLNKLNFRLKTFFYGHVSVDLAQNPMRPCINFVTERYVKHFELFTWMEHPKFQINKRNDRLLTLFNFSYISTPSVVTKLEPNMSSCSRFVEYFEIISSSWLVTLNFKIFDILNQ